MILASYWDIHQAVLWMSSAAVGTVQPLWIDGKQTRNANLKWHSFPSNSDVVLSALAIAVKSTFLVPSIHRLLPIWFRVPINSQCVELFNYSLTCVFIHERRMVSGWQWAAVYNNYIRTHSSIREEHASFGRAHLVEWPNKLIPPTTSK